MHIVSKPNIVGSFHRRLVYSVLEYPCLSSTSIFITMYVDGSIVSAANEIHITYINRYLSILAIIIIASTQFIVWFLMALGMLIICITISVTIATSKWCTNDSYRHLCCDPKTYQTRIRIRSRNPVMITKEPIMNFYPRRKGWSWIIFGSGPYAVISVISRWYVNTLIHLLH